ncbi:MAG: 1-acyl-sn-glycerol-3-phosphate acyltransferase [Treponema sp.]|nr:1-acyl-sn-glycerol-3-phosphate acyltransferase [Treponema sp.]
MIEGKERHAVTYRFSAAVLRRWLCRKFNFECDTIDVGHSPYIVISNHLTNWDPLLIAMSFKKNMYFLASDYVYRVGLKSKLLRFLFSPIARARTTVETSAVITIFKHLREKCNICIFAEGNNPFDGETGEIPPSIGKLIKKSGVAMVTYRFTGTYFSFPRWSRFMHRGKSEGRLVQIYSPEKIAAMTEDEIYEAIKKDIYVNAYEEQKKNPVIFRGKNPAEYLETALYCCPKCRQFSTLKSKGDKLFCKCGFRVRYNESGFFEMPGKDEQPPFTTILDWSKWQKGKITALAEKTLSLDSNVPIFTDPGQKLYRVKRARYNSFMAKGSLYLYNDRLSFVKANSEIIEFPLDTIADVSVVLKMALLFSTNDGELYEIHSNHPISATKYLEMIKTIKAMTKGANGGHGNEYGNGFLKRIS